MIVLAIDPGLSGAIAILGPSLDDLTIHDMPVHVLARGGKAKRDIDVATLARTLVSDGAEHAFVEQVGAMPGQGVASTFAFGKGYGIVLGALAALSVPVTTVPPQRWKKALGVPAGKDAARARASQLMPRHAHHWPLKKHDGRAEAALIALYGWKEMNG